MICLATERIIQGDEPALRIDVHVPEDELYDGAVATLEGVRDVFRSAVLPRKQFRLPPTPFVVAVPGDSRAVVIESVEAWEGDFPGKRLTLISRVATDDPSWFVGKYLEVRKPQVQESTDTLEDHRAWQLQQGR
jgi:hypothetical protein